MAEEMVEGVVDRQRRLAGLSQAIEVGPHGRAAIVQLEIELAASAELEQVQGQAPPSQEARGVGASLWPARIGQALQPGVQLREEVAGGLDQGPADDQGRPALNFNCRARARSSATVS